MVHPSIIAVFDSLASPDSAQEIDSYLHSWIHHKAQNPYEGSLNIKSIAAKVRMPITP
jgi:hypothetical protein